MENITAMTISAVRETKQVRTEGLGAVVIRLGRGKDNFEVEVTLKLKPKDETIAVMEISER